MTPRTEAGRAYLKHLHPDHCALTEYDAKSIAAAEAEAAAEPLRLLRALVKAWDADPVWMDGQQAIDDAFTDARAYIRRKKKPHARQPEPGEER